MRLSRIYTNQPDLFKPVTFAGGLNVVLAEIRIPENRRRDTHNLGKTTLGRLLDFAFLSGKDAKFFLFKHAEFFGSFVFFLEVELADYSFVTIRRSVGEPTKISFKRHATGDCDFSNTSANGWDHHDVPFERARELLDAILDWRALKPWSYRKVLGYLLRSQDDFREVFQLRKFASKHADWKPFLAHMLGFDSSLVQQHYDKERELLRKQEAANTIKNELGGSAEDPSKIEGILLLKQNDADKKQRIIDSFDFRSPDKETTKVLVDDVDTRIAALNARRYSLSQSKKKIAASLEEEQILFDPDEAQRLFTEAGVTFPGQVKRDFEQLLAFNRAITEERRGYLLEERSEIEGELRHINAELSDLGKKRSEALAFLSDTDPFAKYRQLSDEMITLRAEIQALEAQRRHLHRLQELRAEIRQITEEKNQIRGLIEIDVEKQNSDKEGLFSRVRVFFSEIIEEVIDRKALLSVSPNSLGHLEFRAEILDDSGNTTSADLGHTYRKLLCVAFDLALLRARASEKFPRFAYHDGVFESLDDRKKENLLGVIRRYADLGLQPVITVLDTDLPSRAAGEAPVFSRTEVALVLHDGGQDGRLFRTRAW